MKKIITIFLAIFLPLSTAGCSTITYRNTEYSSGAFEREFRAELDLNYLAGKDISPARVKAFFFEFFAFARFYYMEGAEGLVFFPASAFETKEENCWSVSFDGIEWYVSYTNGTLREVMYFDSAEKYREFFGITDNGDDEEDGVKIVGTEKTFFYEKTKYSFPSPFEKLFSTLEANWGGDAKKAELTDYFSLFLWGCDDYMPMLDGDELKFVNLKFKGFRDRFPEIPLEQAKTLALNLIYETPQRFREAYGPDGVDASYKKQFGQRYFTFTSYEKNPDGGYEMVYYVPRLVNWYILAVLLAAAAAGIAFGAFRFFKRNGASSPAPVPAEPQNREAEQDAKTESEEKELEKYKNKYK